MKKVSIIIPNFNNSKYIKRCLDSINNQTYKNIEVFFIDDDSTDDSLKIVNKIAKNFRFDLTTIKQFNQNASIARNVGIKHATGDYLYFLDSDDMLFDENTIEYMVSNIDDNDILLGNYIIVDEEDNLIKEYKCIDVIVDYPNEYSYSMVSPVPSNKFFKREFVEKNGLYFSNVRIGQDLNFYLKALGCSPKIKFVENNLYKYRIVSTSMSRKYNFNFLDIYNSLNEVRKFYNKISKKSEFENYVSACCINHFHIELSKVNKFKKYKEKKMIYTYFDFCLNDFKVKNKNTIYNKEIKKYYIKRILCKLNLFDMFMKIKNK